MKKETLAQAFSCEFCEISKNTFFTEHVRWLILTLVDSEDLPSLNSSLSEIKVLIFSFKETLDLVGIFKIALRLRDRYVFM